MLCLHMWMLLVRLRSEGKDGKDLAQMVYELFQDNVEARVRAEGVKVSCAKASCTQTLLPEGLLILLDPAMQHCG